MIKIFIPGNPALQVKHLVLDYNGTISFDGKLIHGVEKRMHLIAEKLNIHIVTADTFGTVRSQLQGYPVTVSIIPAEKQDKEKMHYVTQLGAKHVIAVGNGRNDRLMLKKAAIGIVVIQGEGAAAELFRCADIVCTDILMALDLVLYPDRLSATLRI